MDRLGQRLVNESVISEKQLKDALERQRIHGGRLGNNLVTLGHITPKELESLFKRHPEAVSTVKDTGLDRSFIEDLMIKHIALFGKFNLGELSEKIKLPISIIDEVIQNLRKDHFVEVTGAAGFMRESFTFIVTEKGRKRGAELMEVNQYVGPAPVTLDDYATMVQFQTIKNIVVSKDSTAEAFTHLVIDQSLLNQIGLAVNAGKATFLYGPPGNGKTTIAETMGKILPGSVYLPHAILVERQIISVFDPVNHIPVRQERKGEDTDQRWLLVKRPVIMTGGELTLKMLDLEFNPVTKFYEAPLQMKANNGLFIVDDFGRQLVKPRDLLNRWIVPLERRVDFLSLHTGVKFDIPFDQLTVFSTNIEPKNLVDEAFLRRIRYKILIDHPSAAEYATIFERVCEANGIKFDQEVLTYLMNDFYDKLGVKLNACHPRDIIDHIIDSSHYYNYSPELTRDGIASAWKNYFVEM